MRKHDDLIGDKRGSAGAPGADGSASPTAAHADIFKSLAEHSLEFIAVCDLEFRPFYVNPSGCRLLGLASLEEACAVKVQDFFFPEDQRFITEELFPKVLKEGSSEVEVRFRHFKTGAALWMIHNVFQVRDAGGRVSGYATVSRDITRRKQAEEALRESEGRLRATLRSAADEIWIVDAQGRVISISDSVMENLGVRSDSWADVEAAIDQLEIYQHDGKVRPRKHNILPRALLGEVIKDEGEMIRNVATEQLRWREVSGAPVRDSDGRIIGAVAVARDITERKQAEEALRSSEKKYRELFESLLEAYCVVEMIFDEQGRPADFRYLETNPAFERHATRPMLGKRIKEIVPDVEQFWIDHYGKVALTGEPVTLEHAVAGLGDQWFRTAAFRLGGPDSRKVAVLFENITARKRAEEALRQSEAKLRAVIEEAPLAMALVGPSGEILFRNPRFDQLWGRPPHVTTATTYSEVYEGYHLDGRKIESQEWPGARSVLKGEVVENEVYEIVQAGGRRITCWFGSAPIRNASGAIAGAVVVFRDVTSERRVEQAMRESQEAQGYLLRLGDALRPLTDPVEVQEAATRVLREHLDAERVLYFEVCDTDYVIHRDCVKGVPSLRGKHPTAAFGSKLVDDYNAGRTVVVKDVHTEPSLSPAERDAYASIVIGAHVGVPLVKGGRLVAGLTAHSRAPREWSAQEVQLIEETAERTWSAVSRARAEAALRKSEEDYRTLFDSIDEGFCVIEMLFDERGKPHDFRFVEVNPAFERHNGLANAKGKTIRELAPGLEAKWFEIYGKVAVTREAIRLAESSEAMQRWFDLYAFPVGVPSERKVAVLFTDITPRKKAEAELARYREQLERLVEERTAKLQELVGELEHFSYTITHDLKSPLRAMRGFAEMASIALAEEGGNGAQEFLERIEKSAERMDKLIADALSYSRAVRQELPLEDVDAGSLLRGMLDSYPEFQPSKAMIAVEGVLPAVLANEAGLTQVFSNLLGNAVKFVKAGEKPKVRVWSEVGGDEAGLGDEKKPGRGWVRIWVEDNGIGINKVMLPRVFDMFSRASRDYDGTGIGLALVRKVVQRMGGKVGVESSEGRGSRFWFEVKAGAAKQVLAVGLGAAVGSGGPEGEGTVLYVEDEEGDAMFMGRAFAQKGLAGKLQIVGDGRAAIEYLSGTAKYGDRQKHPIPTLVLLDLNLPQVSGFEVLAWMRNNPDYARMPVVVFSSSTRADDRLKAQQLGADEFVAKPSSGLEFGKVLERLQAKWLGRRRG